MDPRQRQRLGWIVRFFALLLVLTLLARGTAGAAMASVTVHRPSSGNVTKSVRTTATVSFAGGTPFTVPAGLLVMAVPVQAGQTVKAGDTLAVFDAAEVDRAVNAKRAALQQARTQAAQQTAGDTADPYAAQLAQQQLERAYEETHRIYADGEESVSRAQTKRDEAAAALEKARNAGYADDAEKQAAVENAAAALEAAEDALYSAQKGTLAQGRNALETGEYQLLLVDVGLPDGSGYDLCAAAKSRNIPVIFATARGDEGSVVLGLDMGADDYIVKPFRLREVASRIRAVLRRAAGEREQLVRLGELAVDTQKGQVTRNGTPILLTALEYRLLLTFLSHPGQTLTRGQLLEGIWDVAGNFVNDNTLSVYIKRLRDKLEMPGHPLISTVRGMGYRLEVDGHDKK